MVAGECNVGDKCRTHKNTGACQPHRESHLLLPAQTPHHHRPSGGKRIAVTTNPMQPSKRRTSCLGPLEIRMVPQFSFKKFCKTSVGDGASRQFQREVGRGVLKSPAMAYPIHAMRFWPRHQRLSGHRRLVVPSRWSSPFPWRFRSMLGGQMLRRMRTPFFTAPFGLCNGEPVDDP